MEARYLPFKSDFARVGAWLLKQGFELTLEDPSHTNVFARGSVSKVAAAFGVAFARVATEDGEFTSAVTSPSLPADIAPVVLGIQGLQPHILMHAPRPRPAAVTNYSNEVTPADILEGYNVPASLTGSGQTIAIIMDATPTTSDLTTFWSDVGITRSGSATYTLINVNDGTTTGPLSNSDQGEVTLDTEWSTGVAPGAALRLYAIPSLSYFDLLAGCTQVLSDGIASVASFSASGPEDEGSLLGFQSNSQEFALMAAAGITMLSSSGDSGSNPNTGPTNGYAATNNLSVMYPASDPNVTGVGGTTPTFNASWAMTGEVAWSEIGDSGLPSTGPLATGGGISILFTKPSWQTGGSLLAGETMRCVPDVAAMSSANPITGYGGAFVYMGGNTGFIGTSLSSPIWAGLTAILNQARANAGRATVGLLGPIVYPLASTSSFNDITSGTNGAYTAVAGYDFCTGIGTPNIANIVLQIAPTTPVDDTATGSLALASNIDGSYNTANGYASLTANTSGSLNTSGGFKALFTNSTGSDNTAVGRQSLLNNTSGIYNVALGSTTLYDNTSATYSTAVGYSALYFNNGNRNTAAGFRTLLYNTSGSDNAGTGAQALFENTTGSDNTANGTTALYSNTTAGNNTGDGYASLYFNNGSDNTANGYHAMLHNTTGSQDTAVGSQALLEDTGDSGEVAVGYQALYSNGGGGYNSAVGTQALYQNTSGELNTAVGYQVLYDNVTTSYHTAMGCEALYSNSMYGYNLADGYQALHDNSGGEENVAVGCQALGNSESGFLNIALGQGAGSALATGNYCNIDVGNAGLSSDSYAIRIGAQGTQSAAYVAGIAGETAPSGTAVYIDAATGQLGTLTSSERFKTDIRDMDSASEAILALRPVAFRYRREIDPKGTPQFGLIAEEVDRVSPSLVVHDASHEAYSVRYEAVNAMLLNEFRKQHERIVEQAGAIAKQGRVLREEDEKIASQRARIAALQAAERQVAARQRAIDELRIRLEALEKATAGR
jgi:kumamolisin